MSEEKKTGKRKILVRYLILAACILLIAATTVISICAANNWFKADITASVVDNGDDAADDDAADDEPTVTDTTWVTPLSDLAVITPYDFTEDVSLKNCWHFHAGLDFAAETGTPVLCCYDGTVESIVTGDSLDGNTITISHDNGVKTVYSFLDIADGLKEGSAVKKGDTLGTVSEATGSECMLQPHLHFEVIKSGKQVDPELYLDISSK